MFFRLRKQFNTSEICLLILFCFFFVHSVNKNSFSFQFWRLSCAASFLVLNASSERIKLKTGERLFCFYNFSNTDARKALKHRNVNIARVCFCYDGEEFFGKAANESWEIFRLLSSLDIKLNKSIFGWTENIFLKEFYRARAFVSFSIFSSD